MKITEQITKVKHLMGILNEQKIKKEKKWLLNWFSKVPQEKIDKTFKRIEIDFNKPRPLFFSKVPRAEILKTIENAEIVKMDQLGEVSPITILTIVGHGLPLAFHIPLKTSEDLQNVEKKIYDSFTEVYQQMYKIPPTQEQKKGWLVEARKVIDFLLKNEGKVVVTPRGLDMVSHEVTHEIFDVNPNYIKQIISSICGNGCGQSYLDEPTEIYSYLMDLRETTKMEPTDVITDVSINYDQQVDDFIKAMNDPNFGYESDVRKKLFRIGIEVLRNGKKVYLSSPPLEGNKPLFQIFSCCGKDKMEQVIMQLHNDLAKNAQSQNNNIG